MSCRCNYIHINCFITQKVVSTSNEAITQKEKNGYYLNELEYYKNNLLRLIAKQTLFIYIL